MPNTATKPDRELVGVGLYAPIEAARYARVAPAKFRRWLFSQQAIFEPQLGRGEELVTFLDFAQSLSINDIRNGVGVSLQKIRKAYRLAQDQYGVAYPFGMKHRMFVFGNLNNPKSCEIGVFVPKPGRSVEEQEHEYLESAKRIQLTGRHRGHFLINEVVQYFSKNIEFSGHEGLASAYTAHESHGHAIVMDPQVRFGKPYVLGVGYEAETLVDAAKIEGGIERAARLYHVDPAAICCALGFHKRLNEPPPKQRPVPIAA
jgi:uncharacterized protein (DUF433 family)